MSKRQILSAQIAHREGRLEDFERIIKHIFKQMDTNKNGEVDREEVLKRSTEEFGDDVEH